MSTFSYVRIYTGADGLSHFEDMEVPLTEGGAASMLSKVMAVSGLNFRRNTASYNLDFHPAPRRQFVVNLTGTVEIEASDGEVRRFGPGSVMLAEDTTGKGHISRAIGDEERLSLFIHLPA
ncbi:MAG TPA: hypothetical protein VJB57_19985 [Dehalococcoidia bacterium]|nr:hypothetical protein [Dehalococcoidia bacterium]